MKRKVLAPPPLIFLACYLIGAGLQYLLPYSLLLEDWQWTSWVFIALGSAIMLWAVATMKKHDTPLSPHEEPKALVTSGPYRFSRNPIYIGLTLIYVSMAVYSNAFMVLLMLPVALILLTQGVIVVEEERLKQAFKKEYVAYTKRVRRWL